MTLPAGVLGLIHWHRGAVRRLVAQDGVSVERLHRLHVEALAELEARAAKMPAARKTSYTAVVHQQLMAQLRAGALDLAVHLQADLTAEAVLAQRRALEGQAAIVRTLEEHYRGSGPPLAIEEAARFQGILGEQETSLLARHQASVARYGSGLIQAMEGRLAVGLLTGDTTFDAGKRLQGLGITEWWRAERIVRTELAWAHNASSSAGIRALQGDMPDMRRRWAEHVSDLTGAPLDARVGEDSIAMHGQIEATDGLFTMPADEDVPARWWGKRYDHPPNRSNDRAVLEAWRPHWMDISGWVLQDGVRRDARTVYAEETTPNAAMLQPPPMGEVALQKPPDNPPLVEITRPSVLSSAEALERLEGSAVPTLMVHAMSPEKRKAVLEHGWDWNKDAGLGEFGNGIYAASKHLPAFGTVSVRVGIQSTSPLKGVDADVRGKVHALADYLRKNAPPLVVQEVEYPGVDNPTWYGYPGGLQAAVRRSLLAQGYDAIVITDLDFAVALDPSKVIFVEENKP